MNQRNTNVSIGQPRLSIARASSVMLSHLDIHSMVRTVQLALTSATVASVTLCQFIHHKHQYFGWWRGTAVERRSLAGKLSLLGARTIADV